MAGWPFDAAEAAKRQAAVKLPAKLKIDLDEGKPLGIGVDSRRRVRHGRRGRRSG